MKNRVCTYYHRTLLIIGMSFFTTLHVIGQVTGTVFRDYNGDGVKQSTEPLVTGVVVNAYLANSATPCGTTTTSGSTAPNYTLAGCGSSAVRVEFVIPNTGSCLLNPAIDYTSTGGSSYGSSVQFGTGTSSNVNFAINAPEDFFTASASPVVYVPCYVNGSPANANVAAADAFVGANFDASGSAYHYATVGETGSTWGVAYSRQAGKIFTGAFLKRHVGLGPLGSGGIYMIDPTTNAVTNWLNLSDINIATQGAGAYAGSGPSAANVPFSSVIGTNAQRNLGNGLDQPSYDAPAFAQVGRVSLGDIDISDDGRYLFVMNLYDKRVYRIDLVDPASPQAPTLANVATRVTSWLIPSPGCPNGTHRPFGLEYARGNLFVGLVCSAENGGSAADMDAYVYQVTDFDAGTYSTLFSIPLDYQRGWAFSFFGNAAQAEAYDEWFPWTDNAATMRGSGSYIYPQPVLCDIVFDADGSLIMSFFDRTGHQAGWYNYGPDETDLKLAVAGGDLLRAYYNPTTCSYELESNGKEGPSSPKPATGGAGNGEGPGGGEFYFRDCFDCSTSGFHRETTQGGIAVALGSGEVSAAVIDPDAYDSGGMTWYNNTTGLDTKDFRLYFTGNNGTPGPGTFSKANGLGDLEVSAQLAPLEIGNRVWEDTDDDGVQDAGEPGISGVVVQLWKETTPGNFTQVATVTTGANGNYYFSNGTGTSGPGITYDPDLQPNMNYQLRFPLTSGAFSISTKLNMGGADANADVRDTDASAGGVISFSTGNAGQNNHTYDVAYAMSCSVTINSATPSVCDPATNKYSLAVNVSWTNAAGTTLTVSVPGGSATLAVTAGSSGTNQIITITGLTSDGTQDIDVTAQFDATCTTTTTDAYDAPANCCPPPQTFCATLGESFDLTAEAGLTGYQWYLNGNPIPGANAALYNTNIAGVYTWTALDGASCPIGGCCPITLVESCMLTAMLTHDKTGPVIGTQQPNGSYNVTYTITVTNSGSGAGTYSLYDTPTFDDDIAINGTPSFTTNAPSHPANPGPVNLSSINGTSNTLATGQAIASNATHTYTLTYNVTLDLETTSGGNNVYTACGSVAPGTPTAGQGLFNQSRLDAGNDGTIDETDQVCGDLPYLVLTKTAVDPITDNGNDNYTITYILTVSNLGGAAANYTLTDTPQFDDDATITGASYTALLPPAAVTAPITLSPIPPAPSWGIGTANQAIAAGAVHTYTLTVTANVDLSAGSSGDNFFRDCITTTTMTTMPGNAFFNSAQLQGMGTTTVTRVRHTCIDPRVSPSGYSIGSTVFRDLNNNGLQDPTETGIAGVTMQIWEVVGVKDPTPGSPAGADGADILAPVGSDGTLETADDALPYVSDAAGNYFFTGLSARSYYVVIPGTVFGAGGALQMLPTSSSPAVTDTNDNREDGDDNGVQMGGSGMMVMSPVIALGPGEVEPTGASENYQGGTQDDGDLDDQGDMTVDFGFFAPVRVGDYVWIDLDGNGLQNDPHPVQGMAVSIYDAATNALVALDADGNAYTATQTTTALGGYLFANLPPGNYYVMFDRGTVANANLYTFTTANVQANTHDATDSDAVPTTGTMAATHQTGFLPGGSEDLTLDAGLLCNIQVEAGTPQTICSTRPLQLSLLGASLSPASLGGVWSSSGDGIFLDGGGLPATAFGTAVSYLPGPNDIQSGVVTLTLTSNNPGALVPPSPCTPVSDTVIITVLKVDCGSFPWDGN
ncbi:MAG: hypothetical protein IAE84_17445 [Saprospiraceae bacterium]|nr:hypothetical protein [Saprospiraceae bacterium]